MHGGSTTALVPAKVAMQSHISSQPKECTTKPLCIFWRLSTAESFVSTSGGVRDAPSADAHADAAEKKEAQIHRRESGLYLSLRQGTVRKDHIVGKEEARSRKDLAPRHYPHFPPSTSQVAQTLAQLPSMPRCRDANYRTVYKRSISNNRSEY